MREVQASEFIVRYLSRQLPAQHVAPDQEVDARHFDLQMLQIQIIGSFRHKPSHSIRRRISSAGLPVEVRTDVSDGELVKLYRNAKALILPSTKRSEAYGMVQLESMACGTPVISSNLNTGVSWVNRNGESGFTFTPGDSSDLAGKIRLMISPEFPVKALRDGARKRAEKNFDAGVLFGEVEECLIEAAENSQS